MNAKKLHRWYQDILSGFEQAKKSGSLRKNDRIIRIKGEREILKIPISNPLEMGEHMAIDEKLIGDEFYTILSNRSSGKIAFMVNSLKSAFILKALEPFENQRFKVKTVTRDLASNYDWLCRQAFMNAQHVADKFHVIKLGLEAIQSIRISNRQEALKKRKLALEAHQRKEALKKKKCEEFGESYRKKRFKYQEEILSNGDTVAQLLARSRGLLFKLKSKWSHSQQERSEVLFKKYPKLKTAYMIILQFRKWMAKKQVGKTRSYKEEQLKRWYKRVKKQNIEDLNGFAATVKSNEGVILNYFEKGYTNAQAEALNRNIKKFIFINYGIRNHDYFMFRLKGYFA